MRLRYRLALAAAGLAAGNGAVLARSTSVGRRLIAAQAGVAAGWAAARVVGQPLSFPVWPNDAPWPAFPIVADGLFGLDAARPGAGRRFAHGVPQGFYRPAGWRTNPAFVGWWAVAQLNHDLSRALTGVDEEAARDGFWTQIAWLRANAQRGPQGSALWPYDFPWREGRAVLKPPWVSALSQGLAISALARAWTLERQPADRELARRAAVAFALPPERGGVRVEEASDVFYEEYPAAPYARIFDGFAFGILGLHDLAVHGGDDEAAVLFRAGLATLARRVDDWDFAGCWSWYGRHGLLATAQYNALNACLAQVLGALADEPRLRAAGQRWWPHRLGWSQRALVRVAAALLWTRFVAREALGRV
ncbi:MAG: hypothetical protein HYU88_01605 [Chloroflexi bacterium]|nr:hypothetical protein [Chloroflexota bacterium]